MRVNVKINDDRIILLCPERHCVEICQVDKRIHSCGPSIHHFEVVGKIGAEATWYRSAKIAIGCNSRFAPLEKNGEESTSIRSAGGEDSITGQTPEVTMKHLLERRKSLRVYDRVRAFACVDGWKAFVVNQ
jgi:hypothetical protein